MKRGWQKFCSAKCRNAYHATMAPPALRRDIDALKHQVAELQGQAHAPFDFGDLVRRLEEIERRVQVLDEPVR